MVNRRFSERDCERCGVRELSNYFDVWVFDCSYGKNFPRSKLIGRQEGDADIKKIFERHIVIQDAGDLERHLELISMVYYIDLLAGVNFRNLVIRKMLNKHNTLRVKLFIGELPGYGESRGGMAKLKSAIMRGGFLNKLVTYVFSNYVIKYLEPKVDLAVFSGEICLKRYPYLPKNVIWAHSIDYQIYLDSLELSDAVNKGKSYAVFLDQNGPAHPDYAYHGNKPPVTKDCYYRSLNKFFDSFEKATGIKVIIAGHPRSSLAEGENWPGKQFVLRETPKLVMGAKIVFAHYSTAISFPVLWRKPIIQLTTNEYLNSYRKDRFKAFADRLKLSVLNVDKYDSSMLVNYQKLDIKKEQLAMYEKYELDYLRSHFTEPKNMWKIVAENLQSYNGRHELKKYNMNYSFNNYPKQVDTSHYDDIRSDLIFHYQQYNEILAIYEYGSVKAPGVSDLDLIFVLNDEVEKDPGTFELNCVNGSAHDLVADGTVMKMPLDVFKNIRYLDELNFSLLSGQEIECIAPTDSDKKFIELASIVDWIPERILKLTRMLKSKNLNIINALCVLNSFGYSLKHMTALLGDTSSSKSVLDETAELRAKWHEVGASEAEARLVNCLHDAVDIGYKRLLEYESYLRENNDYLLGNIGFDTDIDLELYNGHFIRFTNNVDSISKKNAMKLSVDGKFYVVISMFYYPHFAILAKQPGMLAKSMRNKISPYNDIDTSMVDDLYGENLARKMDIVETNAVFLKKYGFNNGLLRYGFHFK